MRKSISFPESYLPFLAFGAFLIPIKLSFAYCVLLPLIIISCYRAYKERTLGTFIVHPLNAPLLAFFTISCVTGIFGLNPLKSIPNLLCASVMCFLIPLYSTLANTKSTCIVLGALITGQTIAALHSITAKMFPSFLTGFFVGEVTESGQIGLSLIITYGLIHYLESVYADKNLFLGTRRSLHLLSGTIGILILISTFAGSFAISPFIAQLSLIATLTLIVIISYKTFRIALQNRNSEISYLPILTTVALPVLASTLLINLKRGPWAGVLVGLSLYLCAFRPRVVAPLVGAALIISIAITPVRERLIAAQDHFFISGGRSEIWDIGREMIQTYPLGIGFKNSSVLQKFSNEIPANLRHFHSNPINIAVETGIIGLALFLWWLGHSLKTAHNLRFYTTSMRFHPLAIGIGAAVVSWQVAGLVEYNFGDSEVLYLAYILIGVLGALVADSERNAKALQSGDKGSCRTNLHTPSDGR